MTILNSYMEGRVQNPRDYTDETNQHLGLTKKGSLMVSALEPDYATLARVGRIYVATTGTATAVAPVAAVPTTAAAWALYNGNSATSRLALFPIGISYWSVSGTNGLGSQLFAGLSPTVQASAVTTATNGFVKSTSASARTTGATFGTGVTLAGTPAWLGLEGALNVSSVLVGGGRFQRIDGLYAIPAGFALGITVLGPAGTNAAFGCSVIFAEIESDLV